MSIRRLSLSLALSALISLVGAPAASATSTVNPQARPTGASDGRVPWIARAVRPSWSIGACAGQFFHVQVVNGVIEWGGEQSCTNPYDQQLEVLLVVASTGNLVDDGFRRAVTYQISLHQSNRCQTLHDTKYVEYAYGEANGAKMYPYPATLTFYANCYIPGIARQASRR